jgi:hypothetical protein
MIIIFINSFSRERAVMYIGKFAAVMVMGFVLMPFAVFSETRPDWVPGGKHPSYNPKQYLTGIGIAPVTDDSAGDIQKADNSARAEIAKQIQVSLYEDISTQEENVTETGYDKKVTSKEHSKLKISLKNRQSVNMTLEGIEIAERYFDPKANLYYSFAALNKVRTASRLSSDAAAGFHDSARILREAENSLNRGAYVDGIINFITAADLFENARQDDKIACVLGAESTKTGSIANPNARLLDVIGSIDIRCISGCEQKARIGDPLGEAVSVKVTYSTDTKAIEHLPLKIKYPDGQMDKTDIFYTDPEGNASIKTGPIKKTGRKNNTIEIIPAWDVLEKDALGKNAASWQGRLSAKGAAVQYETRSEGSTRIVISSCLEIDNSPEEDTVAIKILTGQMRAAGFIVSTSDECIDLKDIDAMASKINGKAELVAIIDTEAKRSRFNMHTVYRAGVSFTCYDMLRKEIVATMENVAVGMANDSREAVDRAMTNACSDAGKIFVDKIKENLR